MEMNKLSCCFYPTKVTFIDDDERFLNSAALKFKNKFLVQTFDDPIAAKEALLSEKASSLNHSIHPKEESQTGHREVDVDVNSIHQQIYNPDRFNETSVVVIDYSMPQCDGLEICEALKDTPCKKILLTGEADEKIATEAFNKHIIDKFILKSQDDCFEILTDSIFDFQQQYLNEKFSFIFNTIERSEYPIHCFSNTDFLKLFNTLWKKHDFIEYYLLDPSGSILFVNKSGSPSALIVRDESDMQSAYELIEGADSDIPKKVTDAIKKKEKVLYTGSPNSFSVEPKDWESHLFPAKQLNKDSGYYYAFIDKDTGSVTENIYSLQNYLEEDTKT